MDLNSKSMLILLLDVFLYFRAMFAAFHINLCRNVFFVIIFPTLFTFDFFNVSNVRCIFLNSFQDSGFMPPIFDRQSCTLEALHPCVTGTRS